MTVFQDWDEPIDRYDDPEEWFDDKPLETWATAAPAPDPDPPPAAPPPPPTEADLRREYERLLHERPESIEDLRRHLRDWLNLYDAAQNTTFEAVIWQAWQRAAMARRQTEADAPARQSNLTRRDEYHLDLRRQYEEDPRHPDP